MSLSSVGANAADCLDGRVVVITGASRGIGEAIAYRFAQAGAKVVVAGSAVFNDGDYEKSISALRAAAG